MRWIHSTCRDQRFRSGRAAWTSAAWTRSVTWRWLGRPSGDSLARPCPLRDICPEADEIYRAQASLDLEGGRGSAGSRVIWSRDDEARG